jgi:CheY-like chemotaxis protein
VIRIPLAGDGDHKASEPYLQLVRPARAHPSSGLPAPERSQPPFEAKLAVWIGYASPRSGAEMPKIDHALVIHHPGGDREKIVAALLKCGLDPIRCPNLEEARTLLRQEAFRVVLCRDNLADGDFRAVLREVDKSTVHVPVIVLSLDADWDSYLRALGAGAFDFIVCPPNPAEIKRIIWSALAYTVQPEETTHAAA